MKIIDEKPKKKLSELEPGDVIRAEAYGDTYYFMIADFFTQNKLCFALVQLNRPESGTITVNGDDIFKTTDNDDLFSDIDELIKYLEGTNYINIEKVELEARVKHEGR